MKPLWDIFCSVVDNYGDIGVTWRLARQLAVEHGQAVRLWVDDLHSLVRLCPEVDPDAAQQVQRGVEVRRWALPWQPVEPGDVVIEAFACHLPAEFEAAMVEKPRPPLWINLEYLSAEDWVGGCHGLPSFQSNGLQKFFFFPGFTPETGGLLREQGLIARRRAFQADPAAQAAFLQSIGVQRRPGARLISLFAYENAALGSWLEALAADTQPTQLLVPEGRVLKDLERWLSTCGLAAHDQYKRGALHVQVIPFVEQDAYDRLLWCCDFNAVRGEDSFVRAQWAGRPMLWHIYRQEENAHWLKLDAFLGLYRKALPPAAGAALGALWHAWNAEEDMGPAWHGLQREWTVVAEHAERWCREQAEQTDVAARLVLFYTNWL
ncbi:hypothetical protein BZL41_05015 [Pseudomonas sp. PIC25]|uniref:elongation factor P maturation arginine rhamnosyltransferase EarP n=1 Tax=Pseudomonas sp. PIC25 TaxID=1958773 RepID=UPI000BAB3C72|nr:elongation factor P maturation arginine rhamnosyltransferase EarP [Pseudomonas sp. PIC25]PAU65781.1 hypothetical protein BZL41_05015 [Pseudomonas sp. PIC25]